MCSSDLFGLGLITGAGFVVGLLGQVFFAPFADRGHSKRLLLLGLCAAVAGSVSFALSTSLVMLVLSRCVTGISNSLFLPSVRAIVASIDREHMAQRLGVLGAVELAGFVIGPTVGRILVGPFGLKVPFLVMGSFAVLGLVLLAPRSLPEPPTDPYKRLAFDLLRLPRVRTAAGGSSSSCNALPARSANVPRETSRGYVGRALATAPSASARRSGRW